MTESLVDRAERLHALTPGESFIVQAPAGSGKTELLSQRFLALLARVEQPEEIVAITFTRKAAAEMRGRILAALQCAEGDPAPEPLHKRLTQELARAAREHGMRRGWRLEEHPLRLRIQTIDALCSAIARQMPVLSRLGAVPEIVEDAGQHYREAARRALAELEGEGPWGEAVVKLLRHLDNDVPKAEGLLAALLARRDQWLRHRGSERLELEAALANAVRAGIEAVRCRISDPVAEELVALTAAAAANLEGTASEILRLGGLRELPGTAPEELERWRALARLLLTREGWWRRSVDARSGFPSPSGAKDRDERARRGALKERMSALLERLAEDEGLRTALAELRDLPPPCFSDAQWEAIQALLQVGRLAAADLELVFAERGEIDFSGVSQVALAALGGADQPTDLALALDHRLRHLLVDEVQDISVSQGELIAGLTAGWEPADGRTLFLVGDPMQSIYRFREAEVGLYLQIWGERRLGGVPLTPLNLTLNFRSQAGLVEWFNTAFVKVLPARPDPARGAVPYSACVASHPRASGAAVTVHPFFTNDRRAEAESVVDLVRGAMERAPAATVAILVRSRAQLAAIIPTLRAAGISFQAVEIESLADRPEVLDLLALTRALGHPADRVAWLALLRAPWCGLTLADLEALAGDEPHAAMWELMQGRLARLSSDGQLRLLRVRGILGPGLAERGRRSLRQRVEGAWIALGGPATLVGEHALANARRYLELLEGFDAGGDLPDLAALEAKVQKLYAEPDAGADGTLQIMTMHKAKGLEFDTVILPGLGQRPGRDEPALLRWTERPNPQGGNDLLIAPIREAGTPGDAVYDYVGEVEAQRARLEEGRLLYVAATRARHRLHLLGHVDLDQEGRIKAPAAGSLLATLWPSVEQEFRNALADRGPAVEAPPAVAQEQWLGRLVSDWIRPEPPPAVDWRIRAPARLAPAREPIEYSWAGAAIRHVGTLVHRLLRQISLEDPATWEAERVRALRPHFKAELAALGVAGEGLAKAVGQVEAALLNALADPRGRWLLDPSHRDARSEYAITGIRDGALVQVVLDRTFVDAEGTRWVVDYKLSPHTGGDLEAFLDRQRLRYIEQLERYGALIEALDPRPVRLGLYFPLQSGWREWGASSRAAEALPPGRP